MFIKIENHENNISKLKNGEIDWMDLPKEYFIGNNKKGFLSPFALFLGEKDFVEDKIIEILKIPLV